MFALWKHRLGAGVLRLGAIALVALPAETLGAGELPMLSQIQRGRWQLHDLQGGGPRQTLCIGDPMLLTQVEHGAGACTRRLVERNPRGGTIQYDCGARGFGRTWIRVETPRLVKIDTQGMSGNSPFAYRADARRVGTCRATPRPR